MWRLISFNSYHRMTFYKIIVTSHSIFVLYICMKSGILVLVHTPLSEVRSGKIPIGTTANSPLTKRNFNLICFIKSNVFNCSNYEYNSQRNVIKGVIRSRKSKDRQCNYQNKKYKRTNTDLQHNYTEN